MCVCVQFVLYNMGPESVDAPGREVPFHLRYDHFYLVRWQGAQYERDGQTVRAMNADLNCTRPEVKIASR